MSRFDPDTLRDRAGDKVFARGEVYYRDGQVEILAREPGRVLACVRGTEDYRTELTGLGETLGGICSCRAFEGRGFCKHMVATALAANALADTQEGPSVGPLARIREHLRQKSVEDLVEMIVDLAARHPPLFRKLDMASMTAGADAKTLAARFRKAIDRATLTRGFIDYGKAGAWAAGVDDTLDALAGLVPAGHAALTLELVERAIDRIEAAMERIDDSDGHCGALLGRAAEVHLAAAQVARPEPRQLARQLFVREIEGDYDTFYGAARRYAEVLGERGLAEYRRLVAEAWRKLPPRSAQTQEQFVPPAEYGRVADALDFFAERDGDVSVRIALRAKDLSSPWRYLQLAEFCLAQGREEEALRRAEEGLWVFEDGRPDERLVVFTVGLLTKVGRRDDAEALLWRAFDAAPSFALYLQLCGLGGEVARGQAIERLRKSIAKRPPPRWGRPADLLVQVLTHDKAFDAAWRAVREFGASMGAKAALAQASEATHPRQALEAYEERIDQLVSGGGNQAYAEAVNLLAHMGALRTADAQTNHVEALKARFGRKPSFMKLLR